MSEYTKSEYLSTMDIGFLLGIAPIQARYKAENGELEATHTKNGWVFKKNNWENHPKFQELLELNEKRRQNTIALAKVAKEILQQQREEHEKMENDLETVHTYEIEANIPYRLNPFLRKYFGNGDADEKLLLMSVYFLVMQNEISLEEAAKLTENSIEKMKEYIETYNINLHNI